MKPEQLDAILQEIGYRCVPFARIALCIFLTEAQRADLVLEQHFENKVDGELGRYQNVLVFDASMDSYEDLPSDWCWGVRYAYCQMLHVLGSCRPSPQYIPPPPRRPPMTPEERERWMKVMREELKILECVKTGRSAAEIAQLAGCSIADVERVYPNWEGRVSQWNYLGTAAC